MTECFFYCSQEQKLEEQNRIVPEDQLVPVDITAEEEQIVQVRDARCSNLIIQDEELTVIFITGIMYVRFYWSLTTFILFNSL